MCVYCPCSLFLVSRLLSYTFLTTFPFVPALLLRLYIVAVCLQCKAIVSISPQRVMQSDCLSPASWVVIVTQLVAVPSGRVGHRLLDVWSKPNIPPPCLSRYVVHHYIVSSMCLLKMCIFNVCTLALAATMGCFSLLRKLRDDLGGTDVVNTHRHRHACISFYIAEGLNVYAL